MSAECVPGEAAKAQKGSHGPLTHKGGVLEDLEAQFFADDLVASLPQASQKQHPFGQ